MTEKPRQGHAGTRVSSGTDGAGDYRGEDHISEHVGALPGPSQYPKWDESPSCSPRVLPQNPPMDSFLRWALTQPLPAAAGREERGTRQGCGQGTPPGHGLRLGVARGNCHRRESAESGLAAARHRPGPAAPSTAAKRPRKRQTHRPPLWTAEEQEMGSHSLFNGASGRI